MNSRCGGYHLEQKSPLHEYTGCCPKLPPLPEVNGTHFHQDRREYYRCPVCFLVFVPPGQFLSREDEKRHYDTHENSPDDPRYRRFLHRLFDALVPDLQPSSNGLDFGSGPGPTLSRMFQEIGHSMQLYDPFYSPQIESLQQQYDFITASEVIEHLHRPRGELNRLWSCLKPSGLFGIMTKRVIDQKSFSQWHYKNDPTHVCFYSMQTFEWLAEQWSAQLTVSGNDVVVFKKPS